MDKDNDNSRVERPKSLGLQKVYPPLGYPDLSPDPVTGPDLVTPPTSPHAKEAPMQDFATMGPPSSQTLWWSMQRKADATCQADGVEAGHSGDGDNDVPTGQSSDGDVDATTRQPGDSNDDATNGDTCGSHNGPCGKSCTKTSGAAGVNKHSSVMMSPAA